MGMQFEFRTTAHWSSKSISNPQGNAKRPCCSLRPGDCACLVLDQGLHASVPVGVEDAGVMVWGAEELQKQAWHGGVH
jgi:hypothetical protein